MTTDPKTPFSEREFDFTRGEFLLIDKPKGWTSFDVVNKLRYRLRKITGIKRIKVGHSGTLDPMATGLLLIATGKGTKQIETLTGLPKVYEGTIRFGESTPSYDAETEPNATFPTAHLTVQGLQQVIDQEFFGWIDQIPPIYSAIKIDGKRLYKAARAGKTVEIPSRKVRIDSFKLTGGVVPDVTFEVACSKGTYIRSLAHDLGRTANSGGHLIRLRRTKVGEYHVRDSYTVPEFTAYLDELIALQEAE